MALTDKDLDHLSSLAKIRIPHKLRPRILKDLEGIIEYVKRLDEVDTDRVEPMGTASGAGRAPTRGDNCEQGLTHEEAMKGAPDALRGHFRVPKVLE